MPRRTVLRSRYTAGESMPFRRYSPRRRRNGNQFDRRPPAGNRSGTRVCLRSAWANLGRFAEVHGMADLSSIFGPDTGSEVSLASGRPAPNLTLLLLQQRITIFA